MSALIVWFERRERQLQQSIKGVRKTSANPNPNPNPNPLTLLLRWHETSLAVLASLDGNMHAYKV